MRVQCRICVLRLVFPIFNQIRYEHPHQKTEIVRSPFFFVFSLFFSCLLTFRALIDRARFLLFLHQNRGTTAFVRILVHLLPILPPQVSRGCTDFHAESYIIGLAEKRINSPNRRKQKMASITKKPNGTYLVRISAGKNDFGKPVTVPS